MIRIKAVDAQNLLDVCRMTTNQDCIGTAVEGYCCCNAIFIAKAKYNSEMHPNAIYNNNVPIGFFMFQRAENQADTATICRFMVDDRFQQKGLEEKAFEHILIGLKNQSGKTIILITGVGDRITKKQEPACEISYTGKIERKRKP